MYPLKTMKEMSQGFKSTIALKLTTWFLLLSIFPIAILIFFIRNNLNQQFVELSTQNLYDQTKLLGMGVSLLNDTKLIKILFSENYNKDRISFLINNKDGNIVFSNEENNSELFYNSLSQETKQEILTKEGGVIVDKDKNRIIAYSKIPDKEYVVVTFMDVSDFLLSINQIENKAFIQLSISLIIMVLISGAAIFITMRPIRQLVVITEKVSSGNFDVKIDSSQFEGEMETLVVGFNKMTEDLKKSREKLEKYSKELENRVKERTEKLNEKFDELTKTKTALLNMMEDSDKINKELMKTQNEVKRSFKELKELDKEKDEFISIAAHELKTPMTAISGFAQLLKNENIIEDAEKRNKYLKIVEDEIKRLSKLVTDTLDLSRMDLGNMKFTIEDANVIKVVEEIKDGMTQRTMKKGLKLNFNIDHDLQNIETDKERLKQILINLIDNAIKYTDKGSIKVEVHKEDNHIKFSVTDTGIGIQKKYFKKIFSRFYQVASPYTRIVGGSGLGLSICKELVEDLGGKIWFESKFGKGSIFYFTLPVKFKPSKK